jgi:hypothetical protein
MTEMAETRDTEHLWHLIGPWMAPAVCGGLMAFFLTVLVAIGPLRWA